MNRPLSDTGSGMVEEQPNRAEARRARRARPRLGPAQVPIDRQKTMPEDGLLRALRNNGDPGNMTRLPVSLNDPPNDFRSIILWANDFRSRETVFGGAAAK